jgi:GT2 family glycosyltransferase
LADCLRSLGSQTLRDFEVIVIDNSGVGRVQPVSQGALSNEYFRVISNDHNAGFGAAINQAVRSSESPYVATLNDDAVAHPEWLAKLVACADANPRAGMFASEVHLAGTDRLDSAGMLIAADGTSKQRGHEHHPSKFANAFDTLFPSGSAALYRRAMLDQIGLFDESYFLYCEDTDLGLRGRWAGWECRYVPGAVVEHKYSHSAGRASRLKAYYVERNRLYTVLKNFPMRLLWRIRLAEAVRYIWHVIFMLQGRGKAAEFRTAGGSGAGLVWLVLRAHLSAARRLPHLFRERRKIMAARRISPAQFAAAMHAHRISLREVAAL